MGNGPEESGEGALYKGRGLIQVTGKDNYFWFAASLEITTEEAAEYMQTFEGAAQSACWYWETNNLNKLADAGDIGGVREILLDGQGAFLVPCRRPQKLAAEIARVIQDPTEAHRRATLAQQFAENEYSIQRVTQRLYAIYDEVLDA